MTELEYWFVLPLNAEPWATGPLGYNSKTKSSYMGRNQQLDAYKKAISECIKLYYPDFEMLEGDLDLTFFFWRERAEYESKSTGRKVTKNEVDTTNLQKATEDALQGVLFPNDKRVRNVHSMLVEQGPEVEPKIAIRLRPFVPSRNISDIPPSVWAKLNDDPSLEITDLVTRDVREIF